MENHLSFAEPSLTFRKLHQDLLVFASHGVDEEQTHDFINAVTHCEQEIVQPFSFASPNTTQRQQLQSGKVVIGGRNVDVSPCIQQHILQFSDEFQISEMESVRMWLLASDPDRREMIERLDQLPPFSLRNSIPSAARYIFISEEEWRVSALKELFRLRFDCKMDPKRREFVLSFTNKLLRNKLLQNLIDCLDERLPTLMKNSHLQAAATFWHGLVAECIVLIVSTAQISIEELRRLSYSIKSLCARLHGLLPKVSPNFVNLGSHSQLLQQTSLAGTSANNVVKQVSCLLYTITALEVCLISALISNDERVDRQTESLVSGTVLLSGNQVVIVKQLHDIFVMDKWEDENFQAVTMLIWSAFLAQYEHQVNFLEMRQVEKVAKKAVLLKVFSFMGDVCLKYFPDRKVDPLLHHFYEKNIEQLFVLYVSELNIEVPTCADQEAMNQVLAEGAVDVSSCWSGDCLENIIDFATALCSRDPNFSIQFWSSNESTEIRKNGHNFLIMCRDAAFKDPSFFSAYMKLVATTATGPDCAQRAFQHVKLNPPSLNWDHFFNVMNKYQRLLLNPGESTNISFASKASDRIPEQKKLDRRGPKSIRPKELEALEMIQHVIQSVITDPKLALIFFHNHEWNIVPTLISFLQCTIPSSLKGAIMKSLAIFTRVPDIAPFVWRNVVALQIIRSEQLEPASSVGNQDISFELEHYESMNQSYPATRGFLDLLLELFNSKCIENMRVGPHSESDPMIQSMLNYFDFLVQKVFQKYDLRKYEREEEKWAVVATVLSIFKEILRLYVPNSASPVTVLSELGGRLLERVLSDSSFVEKVLTVFSSDGGVASLENNSEDEKLDRAFRFCKDFISSQNEIPTGNSANSNTFTNSSTEGLFNGGSRMCDQREKSVMYGFEILLLILEKDIETISGDETQKQVKKGLRTEPLHSILLRYRSDLVNIIQYVRYTKNPIIGMLSASVLAVLSERINGPQLVDILVDSGASSEVVLCYTNRLLNMFDDIDHVERKARYGDEGNMRKRTSVLDFNTRGDGKKRTSGVLSLCESRYQTSFGLNDIRTVILDLLLANAAQPGPNLSHLLLGLLDMPKAKVYESRTRFDSCLDAILTLLSSPGFSLESSELAEKCHKLLYILLSQSNTAQVVLKIIETNRYEYFLDHMRLFVRLRNPSSHLTRSKICFTKMFGWYLKSLALYLHIGHGRDVNSKAKTNQIAAALFSTESDVISSSRQSIIVLLRMLDNFDFASSTPPIPKDPRIVSIAESCTSAFGNGAYKWLKIDVEGFYHCLKNSSLPNRHFASYKRFRLDNDSPLRLNLSESSDVENLIYWASEWNLYSEMIASEILAFDSWRQLTEIVALEYLSVEYIAEALRHTGAAIPSSPEAKIDLLGSIIRISLSKILEVVNCPAQLFEIVSHLCVCICSVLARWGNSNNDLCRYTAVSFSLFEMVIRVISSTPGAVGNVAAARNSRSLLYSCIIKLTSNLPDCKELRIFNGDASRFLTENCLDLMCQDASDGYDSLCMGLAISALESVISLETGSVLKIVKERGVLVHFVRIFAKITQIESGEGILDGKLIQGIDLPSSLGAVFDCFLSFFTMVATTPDGALALIEADLLRAMVQCPTIPTHRPKMLSSTFSGTKKQLDCNNTLFDQKWLPVLRLFVTLCSALPENELVAQNVLHFIEIHRKLFSSSFKIELEYRFGLNFLRELAYTTFLFRYVARFSENGESSLGRLRWDKFKSQILHVALSFCSDLLPPSIENDKILDQDVNRKKNSSGWWGKVKPRTLRELNEVGLTRMDLTGLQTTDLNPSALNFLSLSIFDEVKLYTSRMVLCNALSFCSSLSLNESIFPIKPTHETRLNESFALYGSRQMKYSLEAVTPCIEDFLSCFERCVDALEVDRDLSRASVEFGANARNLIEYHIDSMTFAVENMLMVLVQHFHYLSFKRESSNTRVCWLLERLLHALSVLEDLPFIHIIARKLRELESMS